MVSNILQFNFQWKMAEMSYTAQTELPIFKPKPYDSLTTDAITYLWLWFRRTGWIKHATAQYTLQEFISRVLCFWQLLFWLWNAYIIYDTVLDSIYLIKYVTYIQYFCPHPFHPTVTRSFHFSSFLLTCWHFQFIKLFGNRSQENKFSTSETKMFINL